VDNPKQSSGLQLKKTGKTMTASAADGHLHPILFSFIQLRSVAFRVACLRLIWL